MLIDTHVHLDYSDFDPDRPEVLSRAAERGVTEMISIGTRLDSSAKAVELAENFPNVWATVGIHPTEADSASDSFVDELRRLAQSPRVVAIGEIGLDYHRLPSASMQNPFADMFASEVAQDPSQFAAKMADDAYKNQQAVIFRQQLDLAVELELNVVIHQRDAWADTLKILEEYQGQVRGVFHCFGGTLEQARQVLAMGHLVSFTGIVTFKNARQVQETAAGLASGEFMVETDCPYLAPVPYRGKRCEPAYTREVAEKIAELRGESWESIAQQTTETARMFFNFQRSPGR